MLYLNVFLQGLEAPWLTFLMKLFSDMITEAPLCILAVVIFWSVNKRAGICAALSIISTVTLNSAIKLFFKIPRPFDRMDEIKKLDTTEGYSFPSGHCEQAAALTQTLYLASSKRKWVLMAGGAATLLMMISRMYLGMHSVLDVTVGAGLGALTGYFSVWILSCAEKSGNYHILYGISALTAIFAAVHGFDRDLTVMTALSAGAITGYIIEEKLICYKVPEKMTDKIKASAIGLAVILLVKAPFALLNTEKPLTAFFEYIIFGLAITGLAPCLINKAVYGKGKKQ